MAAKIKKIISRSVNTGEFMKVAIQLYGHTRSYKQTYKNLKKYIIEPNQKRGFQFDIFIHTWDELDASQKTWHYKKSRKNMGKKLKKSEIQKIEKYYHPSVISVTPQQKLNTKDLEIMKQNNLNMNFMEMVKNVSYSIKKVNEIRKAYSKKNHIEYDFIIQTRPDILFTRELDLSRIPLPLKNVLFSFISSYYYGEVREDESIKLLGIDLFMIAPQNVMNLLPQWNDKLEKFIGLYPEYAITKLIFDNHVKCKYIAYDKDRCWSILRLNHHYSYQSIFKPIHWLFNGLFYMMQPILLGSPKYRQSIALNPHLLEIANIKKFIKIIK